MSLNLLPKLLAALVAFGTTLPTSSTAGLPDEGMCPVPQGALAAELRGK
jgi:hypothetical protein